jgi:16S rRNA (cytidine1402-2'-O)-methyltransferase
MNPPNAPREGLASGTLYLVPTPLGNLEDITLRALRILREVDWVAAEDTRRARILLRAHDISQRVLSHHAHNEHREAPRLAARLASGENGALITDAGTPGISDPGFLLYREARERGVRTVVLPGPSVVTTALVASGFPTEPFLFLGYLPASAARRRRILETLRGERRTVVLFEVPHRIRKMLTDAGDILGGRPLALLRELTKLHEEILRGTAGEVLDRLPERVRGEIVVVLGPIGRREAPEG